jgi:hypothetical protein
MAAVFGSRCICILRWLMNLKWWTRVWESIVDPNHQMCHRVPCVGFRMFFVSRPLIVRQSLYAQTANFVDEKSDMYHFVPATLHQRHALAVASGSVGKFTLDMQRVYFFSNASRITVITIGHMRVRSSHRVTRDLSWYMKQQWAVSAKCLTTCARK